MENADIVIAATEAPEYVLSRDSIASVASERNGRGLFLFDLAVPRNVEPEAASIDGVSLFNVDDLSAIAEENLEGRKEAANDAETIVEEEVAHFMSWWESLEAMPIIRALREQAETIRKGELDRALHDMPDLSDRDAEALEAMTRSIINRLLHNPTVSLKQRTDEAHLRAARDLFKLLDDTE